MPQGDGHHRSRLERASPEPSWTGITGAVLNGHHRSRLERASPEPSWTGHSSIVYVYILLWRFEAAVYRSGSESESHEVMGIATSDDSRLRYIGMGLSLSLSLSLMSWWASPQTMFLILFMYLDVYNACLHAKMIFSFFICVGAYMVCSWVFMSVCVWMEPENFVPKSKFLECIKHLFVDECPNKLRRG
jgi:hypothetical protein